MVTGATSGVGRAAATALAREGAELFLVARNRDRAERTVEEITRETGNPTVEVILSDFAQLGQVRKAAQQFLDLQRPLHVLLNNAGVIHTRRRETVDGHEEMFAVNHLAPFLLTSLLLEPLRRGAPARVVNVASDAHRYAGEIDLDDLQAESGYRAMRVYGRSKGANLLFTCELARRLEGSGVTVNAMHPGFVGSGFGTNNGRLGRWVMGATRPFARTPERGADTAVWLCVDPALEGRTGGYYVDRRPREPRSWASDPQMAQRLWEASEHLTGLRST